MEWNCGFQRQTFCPCGIKPETLFRTVNVEMIWETMTMEAIKEEGKQPHSSGTFLGKWDEARYCGLWEWLQSQEVPWQSLLVFGALEWTSPGSQTEGSADLPCIQPSLQFSQERKRKNAVGIYYLGLHTNLPELALGTQWLLESSTIAFKTVFFPPKKWHQVVLSRQDWSK